MPGENGVGGEILTCICIVSETGSVLDQTIRYLLYWEFETAEDCDWCIVSVVEIRDMSLGNF